MTTYHTSRRAFGKLTLAAVKYNLHKLCSHLGVGNSLAHLLGVRISAKPVITVKRIRVCWVLGIQKHRDRLLRYPRSDHLIPRAYVFSEFNTQDSATASSYIIALTIMSTDNRRTNKHNDYHIGDDLVLNQMSIPLFL